MENSKQPAFPIDDKSGLTKREYFAGLAMQGILSNDTPITALIKNDKKPLLEIVSEHSISYADELLKQLK